VTSTLAAEYIAMAQAFQDCFWFYQILTQMGFLVDKPFFKGDNEAQIKVVRSPFTSDRLRGVRIAYHLIKDEYKKGTIKIEWISTNSNIADMLTKPLGNVKFLEFRPKLVNYDTAD
jgi:hypothetical protein